MENYLKKSAIRDFGNNIFKNQAGIYIASCHCSSVILKLYFQKCPTVFKIFVKIVIQKLPNIQ